MWEQKYESLIRELLDSQKLGVLATDMDGLPYTSLIAFANTHDLRHFFFATFNDTRKFSNILKNPNITLLVDNRENNPQDFQDATALTIEGKVIKVNEEEKQFKSLFLKKHSYLIDFVNSPRCNIIHIEVGKFHYVDQFQNVITLTIE